MIAVVILAVLGLRRWRQRTDEAIFATVQAIRILDAQLVRLQRHVDALEAAESETRTALMWTASRLAERGVLDESDAPLLDGEVEKIN